MEVTFQKKAWADSFVGKWYVKKVFSAFVNKEEENVLLLVNLNMQTGKEVVDA